MKKGNKDVGKRKLNKIAKMQVRRVNLSTTTTVKVHRGIKVYIQVIIMLRALALTKSIILSSCAKILKVVGNPERVKLFLRVVLALKN